MSEKLVGVQIAPISVLDEGINHCLDLLQETAKVNTLFLYSQTYHGYASERKTSSLADHGVPLKGRAGRNLPPVWVETHDKYYPDTILRHAHPQDAEYAHRDVFAELVEPLRQRGMKLYARILEGSGANLARLMPNWPKVLTIDVYGRPYVLPCWNNPDYRNWWLGTAEDLVKTYPLDGFQFGAERVGPLTRVLFRGQMPTCFCEHCRARGMAKGIDSERARQGFQELYEFISANQAGGAPPADGVLVTVLRILLKYPEVLAWERDQYEAQQEIPRLMYGMVKLIRPEMAFGVHVDHQQSTYDPIFRAEMDFSEVAQYADFIKPIAYHDILGPRLRHWVLGRMQNTILGELSLEQSLELWYDVMGYDKGVEPALDELDQRGLTPDYVYRLTKRIVDDVQDEAAVYPGIGFDVPWEGEHFPSDPENVYQATRKAFEAGAGGVVASREYDEMRVENLRAFGRAVQDASASE